MASNEEARGVTVIGDWIYYISWCDSYKLYKIRTDGTGRQVMGEDTGTASAIVLSAPRPPSPSANGSSSFLVNVNSADGRSLSGKTVEWTAKIKGGSQAGNFGGRAFTNSLGVAEFHLYGNGERHTRTITATVDGISSNSMDVQFGETLPAGFIALASNALSFGEAETYCRYRGGRLPRITARNAILGTSIVEGFGDASSNSVWPKSLPSDTFWTSTESSEMHIKIDPITKMRLYGFSPMLVKPSGGNVSVSTESNNVIFTGQNPRKSYGSRYRAVCVPE